MRRSWVQSIVLSAVFAACAPFASGCAVEMEEPVMVDGYRPLYHDGYVVYYDEGRPYYYMNGAQVWIPASDARYGLYVNHYNTYRVAYGRWHASYGARYRTYRYRGR